MRADVTLQNEPGILILSNERLLFFGRNSKVSIELPTISKHFVSVPSSPKLLYRFVLATGKSHVFEFTGKQGSEERTSMKDALSALRKDLQKRLSQATASSTSTSTSSSTSTSTTSTASSTATSSALDHVRFSSTADTEVRLAILAKDKELASLYNELVGGGSVSDEEFWEARRDQISRERLAPARQKAGMSSAFLSDVRPKAQQSTEIKFEITTETVTHIFKENPMVKKRFKELVPAKMTKEDFWTRYFNHYYLHQNKQNRASAVDKHEYNDVFRQISDPNADPGVQVASAAAFETNPDLKKRSLPLNQLRDDSTASSFFGYGSIHPSDTPHDPANARSSKSLKQAEEARSSRGGRNGTIRSSKAQVRAFVRRVNRHSMIVLEDSDVQPSTISPSYLRTKVQNQELAAAPPPSSIPLQISDVASYFGGKDATGNRKNDDDMETEPTSVGSAGSYSRGSIFSASLPPSLSKVKMEPSAKAAVLSGRIVNVGPESTAVLDTLVASSHVLEENEAASLTRMQQLPPVFLSQLTPVQSALVELLKHFWTASASSLSPPAWPRIDRLAAALGNAVSHLDRLAKLTDNHPDALSVVADLRARVERALEFFATENAKRESISNAAPIVVGSGSGSGAHKRRRKSTTAASLSQTAEDVPSEPKRVKV